MRRGTFWIVFVAICASGITGCGGGSSITPPPPVKSQNFSFYVSGVDSVNFDGETIINPYDIAGVVAIANDGSGKVTGGEQDFSDGNTIASPQPQGDTILSGSLAMQSNGQATLTLVTNNTLLGANGTETFALAFSNANHALISQFDGFATSSGSLDLQTSTSPPSGAFSFVATGSGINVEPVVEGGVFSVDATGNVTGTGDVNDGGSVTLGTPIPAGAMLSAPDAFGRGTVTQGAVIFGTVNYYTVSPKVLRIVSTNLGTTAVGTAYSQGATPNFSNDSIGASVFSLGQSIDFYAAAGQFTTTAAANAKPSSTSTVAEAVATNTFTGVGDVNQLFGALLLAAPLSGSYTLAANGYGSLTFNPVASSPGFGDIVTLGIYAVDPSINILDPNNTTNTAGQGGALLAEMDANLVGIGALIPQTDTSPADVAGAYSFGALGRTSAGDDEFDFVGEATVAAAAFSGSGSLNDFVGDLTGTAGQFTGVTFTGTAAPDAGNPGRLTFTPLALSGTGFTGPVDTTITAYQANSGQLVFVDVDADFESGGTIQQNTVAPAAGAKQAKPANQKR